MLGPSTGLDRETCCRTGSGAAQCREAGAKVLPGAAIMVGRYTLAHQFNRTRRQLKFLRIRLGRVIRDIRPKLPTTRGSRSAPPSLSLWRIRCACGTIANAAIGLCATPPRSSKSARAWPGALRTRLQGVDRDAVDPTRGRPVRAAPRPCTAISSTAKRWAGHHQSRTTDGVETRIHVDKGYRCHNHKEKFRCRSPARSASLPARSPRDEAPRRVEPVIGHTNAEHRVGRNYLKGRDGDRSNPMLVATGHNFSLLLRWLAGLLRDLIRALFSPLLAVQTA